MRTKKQMGQSILATMSEAEIARQMERFRARLATGELASRGISVGTIKRLDTTGDTEMYYPRVAADQRSALPLDAQVAVAVAERIVRQAQISRQRIVGATPGVGASAPLADFLPASAPEMIVILSPIVGG